jgi:DNA modification methylase
VTAADLLTALTREGFTLAAEGDGIRLHPASRLTDALRQRVREHKAELLALLAEADRLVASALSAWVWPDDPIRCRRIGELADAIDRASLAGDLPGLRAAVAEFLATVAEPIATVGNSKDEDGTWYAPGCEGLETPFDEDSQPGPCRYPSHRRWRSIYGVLLCGVCTPPAQEGLVAQWIDDRTPASGSPPLTKLATEALRGLLQNPGEPPSDALHQLRQGEHIHCQEQPQHREGDLGTVPGDLHAAGVRVDRADCLEWFASIEADSVDLVLGSPPYEQARLYLEGGEDLGIARNTNAWVEWMVRVYLAALRCCKGLVAFVVEGQTKDYRWSAAPALLVAQLVRAGVTLRKPPIYKRVGIPGSGGPDWLRNDYEFIVCASRGGRLPWSDNKVMGHEPKYQPGGDPSHRTQDGTRVNDYAGTKDCNNVGPHRARQRAGRGYKPPALANPGNVIECKAGGGNMGDKLCHENEAPFPEALAEFFVRSFCPPGGVVCDPFSGSGTTGAMAVTHGRRFLGCDIRESQVRLSRRRIARVQRELIPGS